MPFDFFTPYNRSDVVSCFAPTVEWYADTIRTMAKFVEAKIDVSFRVCLRTRMPEITRLQIVYVVGGFRSSPYLLSSIKEKLQDLDLTLVLPNTDK